MQLILFKTYTGIKIPVKSDIKRIEYRLQRCKAASLSQYLYLYLNLFNQQHYLYLHLYLDKRLEVGVVYSAGSQVKSQMLYRISIKVLLAIRIGIFNRVAIYNNRNSFEDAQTFIHLESVLPNIQYQYRIDASILRGALCNF